MEVCICEIATEIISRKILIFNTPTKTYYWSPIRKTILFLLTKFPFLVFRSEWKPGNGDRIQRANSNGKETPLLPNNC